MKSLFLLATFLFVSHVHSAEFDPKSMTGRWVVDGDCVDQVGRIVESATVGVSEEMAKEGLLAQMLVAEGVPEFYVSGLVIFKSGNDMLSPSFRLGYSYKDTVCDRQLGTCTGGRTFKIWDRLEKNGVSKKINSCGRWSCGNFFSTFTVSLEGEKLKIKRDYHEDSYSCTFVKKVDSEIEVLP